ncbi:unnamed protein product [Brassicogethes aeneus]|uniref:FAS1 domain-containing protein n=1 Tax=Brassicogethes aeneus TaxID=1431903 RepID=A0A9P0FKD7_BRAAE|nr:unnamed protein product [Brassicogethes aeneus]
MLRAGELVRAVTWTTALFAAVGAVLQLPNTTGIDGQLTANLKVDHFFSLWLVFNNENVKMSDEPFTIFAPQNSATKRAENLLQQPELVKKLLLDHVVLKQRLDLTNVTDISFKTLGGRMVHVKATKDGKLKANDVYVVERKVVVPNGLLVVLDNYLFSDEHPTTKKNATQAKVVDIAPISVVAGKNQSNVTFVENIMEVLSFLKSGVRVFQHFLSRSNVSKLLEEGEEYTVFVPTDHAFQRWHPIDWGFYPFSVPEFTESIITNHFVKGRLKQDIIKDGQTVKTIGGREILFKKTPNLTVNGAMVVTGDTPVSKGNIMFIGEVLFVSESVVSKLHQQHRDKETPPLLAFPWFGAQFLSHAFLALERDKRFSHITRFLNLADLAPHVSGTGYTFFVPTDTAFEKLGLDKMPDNYLSTGDGLQILLNHFVKGRLYDKDLKNDEKLNSLGNKTIVIKRDKENVTVNEATIVESEVFVYNLGTMFYIDTVLFTNLNALPPTTPETTTVEKATVMTTTPSAVEKLPSELTEETGSMPDVLFADATDSSNDTEVKSTAKDTIIK